jgi:hypothetical protein
MMSLSDAPRAHVQREYRKICAWCRCDLGPLSYTADNHSYGICDTCLQSHYADLLDDAPAAAVAVVRTVSMPSINSLGIPGALRSRRVSWRSPGRS